MRAFFLACLAVVVIGTAGYFSLNALQQPTGAAYTTDSARTDPSWSWRSVSTATTAVPCEPRKLWQWFFVDIRRPDGESKLCSDSQ
jgi:hypothetical protein